MVVSRSATYLHRSVALLARLEAFASIFLLRDAPATLPPMAAYLEEPLYAFWKNPGAGEDTAETPGMRVDIERYRMKYRAYRLGYGEGEKQEKGLATRFSIACRGVSRVFMMHMMNVS